jgi:ribosomal protein S18 acetylase RimI-like enzyme
VGFNACKIDHSLKEALNIVLGSIVLIGVHPEAQGRGIGSALVEASVKWFSDKCDYLQVRTELANHAAIRMYQKVGFAIVESSIYYRKWVHVKDSTP